MTSPRPTPLTDEEGVRFGRIMINWCNPPREQVIELVPADFARQLERDRQELIEALRAFVTAEQEWAHIKAGMPAGTFDDHLGDAFQKALALLARLEAQK